MDFRPHMANIISKIGGEVLYLPIDGEIVIVNGFYQSPPREFLGVASNRPTMTCLLKEVPFPRQGDAFEWDDRHCRVVEVEKDEGCGLCVLSLEEA